MKFSDYIKIAFSALKGNRLRSILTLLIISFGIMALIIIFTCIDAIRGNITENFIELGAGAFTVQKEEGLRRRSAANAELKLITFAEAESFAKKFDFPATLSLNTTVDNNITIKTKFKESNPNVSIEAGDIAYIDVSGKNITAGRNFTEMEILNGSNVTVIGYDAAGKVYPAADSVVGSKILIDGKKYSVVGLLESKGASAGKNDNFVLIPYTNARKDFDLSSTSFNVIVEAANPDNLEKAIAEAEGVMRNVKKLGALDENNFSITRSDKLANTYLEQISFIEVATGVIGFLTLLGAGVGLMNIMLVSVNERTREIGLSKSLGATSRTIFMQFLLEAITICVFGGIVGVVLGLILGNLIAIFVLESKFTLAIAWVIGGILFCTMIGLLAGLFPAYRASKLNPVDALRYE
ncbi:MAG: putative ABC transport system permease protein [Chitinophagales bacterium]